MKNTKITLLLSLLFWMGSMSFSIAQTDKELLRDLMEEEQEAVNALVLYPEETRKNILESTLHPEALIKVESIQNRTSTAFRELMQSLPQSDQEAVWDLTRYPGLIHQLALQRSGSEKSIESILADYPEVIHRRAKAAVANQELPLVAVDELNQAAQSAFDATLAEYPPNTQASLRALIALPEVLTILTDNIRLTVLVGHVYAKEPDWVLQKADSMHLEVARQNAQELEDWKTSLENDPQALEELNASVESYNEAYGYDDSYYDYEEDAPATREEVIVHYHYDYYYPYWFGYPYWYTYPRWRYYPSWYDWGFYYYPDRPVFIIGLPSFYFMHWYFNNPYHHHHYPHLSAQFVRHYNGHRRSGSGISTGVSDWRYQNRAVISEKWLKDDGQLTSRFKEYGAFETSREKYNQKNPNKEISRTEYLNQHEKKYPSLSNSTKELQNQKGDDNPRVTKSPFDSKSEKPKTNRQKTTTPVKPNKTDQSDKSRDKNARTLTKPKTDPGKDYHKNTWEQSSTKRQKTSTKTTPPKVKKSKQPSTSKKTVKTRPSKSKGGN